jgi:hypothetical protein
MLTHMHLEQRTDGIDALQRTSLSTHATLTRYYTPPSEYSHFHGFTPTGEPTLNFFES